MARFKGWNQSAIKSKTAPELFQQSGQICLDKKKKPNAKIKGATKTEVDGIKFDSRLEAYMYKQLKASRLNFDLKVDIVLQNKFRYGTEAVRELKINIDFVLPWCDLMIDTKGFQTYDGKIKHKLLKHHLYQQGKVYRIELPKNQKECDALIFELKQKKFGADHY